MGFRGFTRQMQRNGAWLQRLALGTNTDPVFPPLHIKPTDEPTGDGLTGDIYVSAAGALYVHDGAGYELVADAGTIAGTADVITGGDAAIDDYIDARAVHYVTIPYNVPADQNVFIAPEGLTVTAAYLVPTVAGSDGSDVELDITKCTGTDAPSAGDSILDAPFDLKGTAHTVQSDTTLSGTPADLDLDPGDRLAFDITGTATAATGVVTIVLRPTAS